MAISEAQQKAVNKYVKNNYDRINVTFPKGEKANIQAHAKTTGESVNAFITRAVKETIERESTPITPAAVEAPNTDSVDLSRLHSDIAYQFEIRDIFGNEVLAELLKKPLSTQKSIPEE